MDDSLQYDQSVKRRRCRVKVELSELELRYRNMPEEEFTPIKREDLTAEAQTLYDREAGRRASVKPGAADTEPLEQTHFDPGKLPTGLELPPHARRERKLGAT